MNPDRAMLSVSTLSLIALMAKLMVAGFGLFLLNSAAIHFVNKTIQIEDVKKYSFAKFFWPNRVLLSLVARPHLGRAWHRPP